MKTSEFKKGQYVIVTTKNGNVKGVISSVDTNICTWETEYSVDYLKNGKTWTMIGVPARAIDLA
ncbi:hypothetical protein ACIXQB_06825 [Bacteroides fragilis]